MKTLTVTKARQNFFKLIEEINNSSSAYPPFETLKKLTLEGLTPKPKVISIKNKNTKIQINNCLLILIIRLGPQNN